MHNLPLPTLYILKKEKKKKVSKKAIFLALEDSLCEINQSNQQF